MKIHIHKLKKLKVSAEKQGALSVRVRKAKVSRPSWFVREVFALLAMLRLRRPSYAWQRYRATAVYRGAKSVRNIEPRAVVRHTASFVMKAASMAAIAALVILPAFSAFEAHIINVTAELAMIDPPFLNPPDNNDHTDTDGGGPYTDPFDVEARNEDPDGTHIYFTHGPGTDPGTVPDPACGEPADADGGGGPVVIDTEILVLNLTGSTVIKAITCDGDDSSAHKSLVNAKIYEFEAILLSACPAEHGEVVVDSEETGSIFDYGDNDVVIEDGGALKPSGTSILVKTNCDLTIEGDGEIDASSSGNGGTVTVLVGGNLSVAGDSIKATGGSGGGTQLGGTITISVGVDFVLSGLISSGAQENGGEITIDVENDFTIEASGEVLARAGTGGGTQTGGTILINVGGDFSNSGEVDTFGDEAGGRIEIEVGGTAVLGGSSIKANGSTSGGGTQRGGIVRVKSSDDMTVPGTVEAKGDEFGGIIELITSGIFTLTASGEIEATGGSGGGTQRGGNVSIIALGGDSSLAGPIDVSGEEQGGRVAVTVKGDLTVSDEIDATGGSGGGDQLGGRINLTTPGLLTVSSALDATAQEEDGAIQTNYCSKNFTGATFTPAAVEIVNCDTVVINEFLPNPAGADDAAMPDGEWVELYNYGTAAVDVSGWFLYDSVDGNELPILASNTNTGGTVVPAGGFLVVFRDGDADFALNNSGADSVRLFDDAIGGGGVLRDRHDYDGRDFASLTPTPGDPNENDSTGGAGAAIPEDKSFARVPDGGVWYDPVPTPGSSNAEHFDYFANHFGLTESEEESVDSSPEPVDSSQGSGGSNQETAAGSKETGEEAPDETAPDPVSDETAGGQATDDEPLNEEQGEEDGDEQQATGDEDEEESADGGQETESGDEGLDSGSESGMTEEATEEEASESEEGANLPDDPEAALREVADEPEDAPEPDDTGGNDNPPDEPVVSEGLFGETLSTNSVDAVLPPPEEQE